MIANEILPRRPRAASEAPVTDPRFAVHYDNDAEKAVLGCMMAQPAEVIDKAAAGLVTSDFFVPAHQVVFRLLCDMYRKKEAIDVMTVHHALTELKVAEQIGSPGILAELLVGFATHLNVASYIKIVKDKAVRRAMCVAAETIFREATDAESVVTLLDKADETIKAVKALADGFDDVRLQMEARKFDQLKPPPKTEPVILVNRVAVAKPGDLVVVSAEVKSGKSAMLGAMIASMIAEAPGDFLGIVGRNPDNLPILHIDTEQSPEDYHELLLRTLKRAGITATPPLLRSYCLTDMSVQNRKRALFYMLKHLHADYPALCAVIIDGVADLCLDVNDPIESNLLVDELYSAAIRYRTPLICVLHENPGTLNGKTRGHLGSQLARKAASNLRLTKSNSGVIQMFTETSRRGFIPKDTGPHFTWDDEKKMHVSVDATATTKAKIRDVAKADRLYVLACNVFDGRGGLKWADTIDGLMEKLNQSKDTAKRRLEDMRNYGIVTFTPGVNLYSLNPNFDREN